MQGDKVSRLVDQALQRLAAALERGYSEELKRYLKAMGRFHRYSAGNVLLISMACPQATRVAGYRTWQKLGRYVKSGEKGIAILAPVVLRKPDGSEGELVAFKVATVFDFSQTDGAELPAPVRAGGDAGLYASRLKQFIVDEGITLEYAQMLGSVDGLSAGRTIVVRANMPSAEEFSVLVHEFAHTLLHQHASAKPDRAVRELEAEAVAFVVGEAIGIDGTTASSDYIQLYRGNRKMLFESLQRIQHTAAQIINGIGAEKDRHFVESESPAQVAAA